MDTQYVLRHLVATIAYRARKAFVEAPDDYPNFNAGAGVRTPIEIVNHMSGVLDKAITAYETPSADVSPIGDWQTEVAKFYQRLERLDRIIAEGNEPLTLRLEQIVQGPLSDVLTHIGQLYTLRRLAGTPVEPESFIRANIQAGNVADT